MFVVGDVVKVEKRCFKHPFISSTSPKLDGFYYGVVRSMQKRIVDVFFFYDNEVVQVQRENVILSSEDDCLSTIETQNYIEYKKASTQVQLKKEPTLVEVKKQPMILKQSKIIFLFYTNTVRIIFFFTGRCKKSTSFRNLQSEFDESKYSYVRY